MLKKVLPQPGLVVVYPCRQNIKFHSALSSFQSSISFKWANIQPSTRASSSPNCRTIKVWKMCWYSKVRIAFQKMGKVTLISCSFSFRIYFLGAIFFKCLLVLIWENHSYLPFMIYQEKTNLSSHCSLVWLLCLTNVYASVLKTKQIKLIIIII